MIENINAMVGKTMTSALGGKGDEAFDAETDGAQIIIYTMQAKAVLLASDNEDAYVDEFGEPAPSPEAAALMAFRVDILEAMNEDPNKIGEE